MSDFKIIFKINGANGIYTREVSIATETTPARTILDAAATLTKTEQKLWVQVIIVLFIGSFEFQNISTRKYFDRTGAIDPDNPTAFLPKKSATS